MIQKISYFLEKKPNMENVHVNNHYSIKNIGRGWAPCGIDVASKRVKSTKTSHIVPIHIPYG